MPVTPDELRNLNDEELLGLESWQAEIDVILRRDWQPGRRCAINISAPWRIVEVLVIVYSAMGWRVHVGNNHEGKILRFEEAKPSLGCGNAPADEQHLARGSDWP